MTDWIKITMSIHPGTAAKIQKLKADTDITYDDLMQIALKAFSHSEHSKKMEYPKIKDR